MNNKNNKKIPKATILRLSMYHRYLQGLLRNGTHVISSADLAHFTNVNPAQLRKDLSYFGKFGVRGVGYQVEQLVLRIQNILGLEKEWRMALVGVNYIGQALL
ncbi:MAG: redox-sensing transcriptional repressor Rex [Dissulfurimicrobium sp.]|uniref:redox-sensing transcriptional repressor Rex n=1 Tax=Dissulfurimicrobium sp. TaxID=2022436 RepID=UPI00404B94CE